jgi:DNA-binding CsgD family transcriptional regulator
MNTMPLSPREKRLLRRFAAGKTDKEIAGHLGGTAEQVSAQRARLLSKLQISSKTEIAEAAKRLAALATYKGAT